MKEVAVSDLGTLSPPYWQPGDFEEVNGYPRYSAVEMTRRHQWIAEIIDGFELDAVVVGGASGPLDTAVQYFTNWPPQVQSYVLFRHGHTPELIARLWNHLPDAKRISTVDTVTYGGDSPAQQAEKLAAAVDGSRRVGLVGTVPHGDLFTLQRNSPTTKLVDLNEEYQKLRLVKTEAEMVFTRIASRMNDAAVSALASELRPGRNEMDVAQIVESEYLAHQGVNLIHFSLTTPMSEPQVCVPHQYHPNRVIRSGDVFVTEISTTFWGYSGQILRTFVIDAEPSERYRELFDVALDTYQAIRYALRPGISVDEVLDLTDGISAAGFDIWDDLVHGFGGAYLPPIVRTKASRGYHAPPGFEYPEGALVVVQPNVISGTAGVQVGDSMWITANGVETTQAYPLDITRCG